MNSDAQPGLLGGDLPCRSQTIPVLAAPRHGYIRSVKNGKAITTSKASRNSPPSTDLTAGTCGGDFLVSLRVQSEYSRAGGSTWNDDAVSLLLNSPLVPPGISICRSRFRRAAGTGAPCSSSLSWWAGNSESCRHSRQTAPRRSEEHTSELQSLRHLVCRLLLE